MSDLFEFKDEGEEVGIVRKDRADAVASTDACLPNVQVIINMPIDNAIKAKDLVYKLSPSCITLGIKVRATTACTKRTAFFHSFTSTQQNLISTSGKRASAGRRILRRQQG